MPIDIDPVFDATANATGITISTPPRTWCVLYRTISGWQLHATLPTYEMAADAKAGLIVAGYSSVEILSPRLAQLRGVQLPEGLS